MDKDIEDIVKMLLPAVLGVLALIAAVFFFIYVVLPIGAVVLAWLGYQWWHDHPDQKRTRDLKRIEELRKTIIEAQKQLPGSQRFGEMMWERIAEAMGDTLPSFALASNLFGITYILYEAEGFAAAPREVSPAVSDLDRARALDELSALAHRVSQTNVIDIALEIITSSFLDCFRTLPAICFEPKLKLVGDAGAERLSGQFYISLASALGPSSASVDALVLPFFSREARDAGLFSALRDQLNRNQHQMSGVPFTITHLDSPKLIMPSKHDGSPNEIIRGYLHGTPFEAIFSSVIAVQIPVAQRFQGTWIIAPPGSGKTTLLSALLKGDLDLVREGKASVILMDSKGTMTESVKRLARFEPGGDLEGKLVFLEPRDNVAINPLDLGATLDHQVDLLNYLFSFGDEMTNMQATLFFAVLRVMKKIPQSNFATFIDFLLRGWQPYRSYVEQLDPRHRIFFINPDSQAEWDQTQYKDTKQQVLRRIRDLTTRVPLLETMFEAPTTRFNLAEAMDAGKVIVIDTSTKDLGDGGSQFFGRLILALLKEEAEQREGRADEEKLPCFVYIDDCHEIISNDENVNRILTKCRSQKIGLTLAHQKLTDIRSDRVRAALRDSGIRIANSDDEAPELAGRMRTTTEQLRSLPTGRFALFLRGILSQPLIIDVPPERVDTWPQMEKKDFTRLRDEMRRDYCWTPKGPGSEPQDPEYDTKPVDWEK